MKPRTVIALVVILLLCVGYVVVRKSGLFQPGKDAGAGEPKALFDPDTKSVARLTVADADGHKVTFAKEGDDWRLVEPVRSKAESYMVTEITSALEGLKGRKVSGDDAQDSLTGLSKPRWTLTFTGAEGPERTIYVGKARPMSRGELYVRLAGADDVFVVKADIESALGRRVSEYRSKTVLDIKKEDVLRVDVRGARPYRLARNDAEKPDRWTLTTADGKISAPADKDKVEDLLGKFNYLSADKFVDEAKPETVGLVKGKEPLALTVTMKAETTEPPSTQPASRPAQPKAGKVYRLVLGDPAGFNGDHVYARFVDEPGVFTVSKSLVKDLQPDLTTLRDKKVIALDDTKVNRIVLDLPACKAELAKGHGGVWKMVKPFAGNANASAVTGLLTAIKDLKAESFEDTLTLGAGAGTVTLGLNEGGLTSTLKIGKATSSGLRTFVQLGGEKGLKLVSTDGLAKILADPAVYWETVIWEKPFMEGVTGVRLARRGAETVELAKDAKGGWTLTRPVKADADGEKVDKIVNSVTNLNAEKVVSLGPAVPDKYAKAADRITIQLTTEMRRAMRMPPPAPSPGPDPTDPIKKLNPAAGVEPAAPAAKTPATKPAAKPPAKPATKPAAKPPAKPTTQPATKPATQPATQPAPVVKTYTLQVAKVDGKCYVWVEEGKIIAVGEFPATLWDDLTAGLRDRTVLEVVRDDVSALAFAEGGKTFELKKDGKDWNDAADALLTIDADKVKDLLNDLASLTCEEFVSHTSSDAAKFGLDKPARTLTVRTTKGPPVTLSLSAKGPEGSANRYATVSGVQGVFVLSEDNLKKVTKARKDFLKK